MTNLADRYAFLKDEVKRLSAEMNAVADEIKATGRERVVGERAIVVVALYERTLFDSKAAKAMLTPEQIAACQNTILCERLDIKPVLEDVFV